MYVDGGCPGCDVARRIAAEITSSGTSVDVTIVEIADVPALPEAVIAVPAYVLDGSLMALGNPDKADIYAAMKDRLKSLDEAERC